MTEKELLAGQFEANRAHLRAVAYRMLSSLTEGADAVRDGDRGRHREVVAAFLAASREENVRIFGFTVRAGRDGEPSGPRLAAASNS